MCTCSPFPGYGSGGERLVAGVVPLNASRTHVLLIQSHKRSGWVLPKGGWESDEECMEAAEREAWEEAGIQISIDYDLGEIKESRPPKAKSSSKGTSTKSLYQFYEATVTVEAASWPEKHKRDRWWATYAEAKEALKDRPDILEALERSTIQR